MTFQKQLLIAGVVVVGLALGPGLAASTNSGSHGSTSSGSHGKSSSGTKSTSSSKSKPAPKAPASSHHAKSKEACSKCTRDAKGRIARSESAKDAFMRQTGYPHGRKGWVVDHIKPLACGGTDAPSNMQWQTAAEAKAKDKIERKGC